MRVDELLKAAFFEGMIFICHRTTCQNEEMFTVETDDGKILFEVTKRWFDDLRSAHPSEAIHTLECGCVVRSVIPNGSLHLSADGIDFSLN